MRRTLTGPRGTFEQHYPIGCYMTPVHCEIRGISTYHVLFRRIDPFSERMRNSYESRIREIANRYSMYWRQAVVDGMLVEINTTTVSGDSEEVEIVIMKMVKPNTVVSMLGISVQTIPIDVFGEVKPQLDPS